MVRPWRTRPRNFRDRNFRVGLERLSALGAGGARERSGAAVGRYFQMKGATGCSPASSGRSSARSSESLRESVDHTNETAKQTRFKILRNRTVQQGAPPDQPHLGGVGVEKQLEPRLVGFGTPHPHPFRHPCQPQLLPSTPALLSSHPPHPLALLPRRRCLRRRSRWARSLI